MQSTYQVILLVLAAAHAVVMGRGPPAALSNRRSARNSIGQGSVVRGNGERCCGWGRMRFVAHEDPPSQTYTTPSARTGRQIRLRWVRFDYIPGATVVSTVVLSVVFKPLCITHGVAIVTVDGSAACGLSEGGHQHLALAVITRLHLELASEQLIPVRPQTLRSTQQ